MTSGPTTATLTPGGRVAGGAGPGSAGSPDAGSVAKLGGAAKLEGAALRAAQKEVASLERRLAKRGEDIAALHEQIAGHDHSDFTGLARLTGQLGGLEAEVAELEERWLELSEGL